MTCTELHDGCGRVYACKESGSGLHRSVSFLLPFAVRKEAHLTANSAE